MTYEHAEAFVASAEFPDYVTAWLDRLASYRIPRQDWRAVVALYESTERFAQDVETWRVVHSDRFVREEASEEPSSVSVLEEWRERHLDEWGER